MNSVVGNGFIPTTLEVSSLGIGFANISNLYKLDMTDDEYLVVGERHTPTDDPLDTKWNMIVNNDGVCVNASRRVYNTVNSNLGKSAGLFVGNNIVCAGNIHASGLVLDNITIANDINSNVLDSFIQKINDKIQPFQTGFTSYIPDTTGAIANVDNIYTTSYISLGGYADTFSNSYPLNIVETANNTIDNIHICIKNDVNNEYEATKLRMGIIGGSNISPAIISTTEGMPLEFHVSISSTDVNKLYGGNSLPNYTNSNLINLPAMSIDAKRNVGIGTNNTGEYTYNKISLYGQNITKSIITENAKLQVEGLCTMKDIVMYDYYTKQYAHLDDIYVRSKGMTIYAGQIGGGIFNDFNYTFFYDLQVNQLLNVKNSLTVDNNATVNNILNANRLIVNGVSSFVKDAIFNDNVFFQKDMTLNRNLNIASGDLFYNGDRVNILNTEPIYLDPSIINTSNITSNSVLVFAQKDIFNVSGKNVTFPGRVGIGINNHDTYNEQLNIIKDIGTKYEVVLQDNSDQNDIIGTSAYIGHLTELNPFDNSLIINTNKHPLKWNNIYFYPGKDMERYGYINNGEPTLAVNQNNRVGINTARPSFELDVSGHISANEIFLRRNKYSYKSANFLYSNDQTLRFYNIYDPLTDKFCINYNYITTTRDMKGLNVKKGINADNYYHNNVLTETLKSNNDMSGFYTNKKLSLGWTNEKSVAPLQIRNMTIDDYNYSVLRIYRGKRGGGATNNADYSGVDICEYETDLPFLDRNKFKWFMYKNHLNKTGTDNKKRIGPLQFGYTNNTYNPTSFGMSIYYNEEFSKYHIDVNKSTTDFTFNPNTALSVYGDLEVHGNINIIDKQNTGFTYQINGIQYSSNAIQNVIDNNNIRPSLGGDPNKNDIVINAEKITLIPNHTTLIGYADNWFLNYANNLENFYNKTSTPLIVYQNNVQEAVSRFVTTGTGSVKSSSAIEIGTYNTDLNYNGDIKNMVEFKVSGFSGSSTTLLELSSYDKNSSSYNSFISFYNNSIGCYTHIGNYHAHNPNTGEIFVKNVTLHIDDFNTYGIQVTNREKTPAINLHRLYGDSNIYYILSGCDDDYKFKISAANSEYNTFSPTNISNIFVIDAINNNGMIRKGARFGFNVDQPSDTICIESLFDEPSVKITNRYTEKQLYNEISSITIINSNLLLKQHDVFDIAYNNYSKYIFAWDNSNSTYYTGVKYIIEPKNIPDRDNNCNIIFHSYKSSSNFVVNSNIILNNSNTYVTVHNLDIDFYASNLYIKHEINQSCNIDIIDISRYNFNNKRIFHSSNCFIDLSKKFNITPIIDIDNSNIDVIIDTNDISYNNIFFISNIIPIQITNSNSIDFASNYNIYYNYSNYYTLPNYLIPYYTTLASSKITLSCNIISYTNPKFNSNFFNIHNNIFTFLKQPNNDIVNNIYNKYITYIDYNTELIGENGIYDNIYVNTTTSNTIWYNDTIKYRGNLIANRKNTINVEASILIPETIVALEEDRVLNVNELNINVEYNINSNANISNIYFDVSSKFLAIRPRGLIEIYDYNDRIVKKKIHEEKFQDKFDILGVPFVNDIIIKDYYYVYDFDTWYNYEDEYYNKFYLYVNRIKYLPHLTLVNFVDLDNALPDPIDKIHKIYSYDGTLELFMERKEGFVDSIFRITEDGDAVIKKSITTNDIIIDGFIYDRAGNNLLKMLNNDFSNQFREIYTDKFYLNSCNIMIQPTGENGIKIYSTQRVNYDHLNYNIFTIYDDDTFNSYNIFNVQKGGKITINREEDARYDVDIYGTTYSTEFISEVVYTSNLLVYGSNTTILTPMYNFNRVAVDNSWNEAGEPAVKIINRSQENALEVYQYSSEMSNLAIIVSNSGLVGINMKDPQYNFDVFGNGHISSLLKTSNLEVYGDEAIVYSRLITSNFLKVENYSEQSAFKINNLGLSNAIEVLNSNNSCLTINNIGYLGLGKDKNNPEYDVDIRGDFRLNRPINETNIDTYMFYEFRNNQLLTYDTSSREYNISNIGCIYEFLDNKNSVNLHSGSYLYFEDDIFSSVNDLTISGWVHCSNLSDDNYILDFRRDVQFIDILFPRENITSELYTDSHGNVIKTTESSYKDYHKSWYLFDNLYFGNEGTVGKWGWESADNTYDSNTGIANETTNYFQDHTEFFGEWMMIDIGENIYIDRYRLFLFNGNQQSTPNTFRLYASDDANAYGDTSHSSWEIIDERIDISNWVNENYFEYKTNTSTKTYRLFALVIHKIQTYNYGLVNLTQIEIYGKISSNTNTSILAIQNNNNSLSFKILDNIVYTYDYNDNIWFHFVWNILNSTNTGYVCINNGPENYFDTYELISDYPLSSNIYLNTIGKSNNYGNLNIAEFRIITNPITYIDRNNIYNPPVLVSKQDRIGINIFNPIYNLDVFGDAHVSELLITSNFEVYGDDATIHTRMLNSNFVKITNFTEHPSLKINNYGNSNAFEVFDDERVGFIVTKGGNVGINTYYPVNDFEVIGDVHVSELMKTSNLLVYGDDVTIIPRMINSNFVKVINESDYPSMKIQNYGNSNACEIFTDEIPAFIVTKEGNIGINTYEPNSDYKLEIFGNIHTTELSRTCNLLVYGDYVNILTPTSIYNTQLDNALTIQNNGPANVLEIYDDSMIVISIPKKPLLDDITAISYNKIGINIIDPKYTIDVFGDAHVSEALITSNLIVYGDDATIHTRMLNSNFVKITNFTEHPSLKINNYGNSNAFEVFDDERVGFVVTKGGNVGINTYYPVNDFEVIGDVHVSELMKTSNLLVYGDNVTFLTKMISSNYVNIIYEYDETAFKIMNEGTGNAFEVISTNMSNFTIANNGLIGINNNNPKYQLDLIGDIRVSQTLYTSNIVVYGENTRLDTTTYQSEKMEIISQTEGPALTVKQYGIDDMFHVYDDDDIVFVINNTRKVGINMMLPKYDLDITGDTHVSEALITSDLIVYGDDATIHTRMINSNFIKVQNYSDYPSVKIRNYGNSNAFEVFDDNKVGLVVTKGGNVGINTYSPTTNFEIIGNMHVSSQIRAYKLDVYGEEIVFTSASINSNYIDVINHTSYPSIKVNNYGSSNAFEIFDNDILALNVIKGGNVGINTYNPTEKFEVNGDMNVVNRLKTSNLLVYGDDMTILTKLISSNFVKINNKSEYPAFKVINYGISNAFEVFDDNRASIIVAKGGNVGINTYVPQYDMHVHGIAYSTYFKGDGSNLYNVNFLDRNTSMLVEGSNLYYTAFRTGTIAQASNIHASNLVYNVSNILKYELDLLSRFVDNISLQTGLGNVVVEYDFLPNIYYDFTDLINTNNNTILDNDKYDKFFTDTTNLPFWYKFDNTSLLVNFGYTNTGATTYNLTSTAVSSDTSYYIIGTASAISNNSTAKMDIPSYNWSTWTRYSVSFWIKINAVNGNDIIVTDANKVFRITRNVNSIDTISIAIGGVDKILDTDGYVGFWTVSDWKHIAVTAYKDTNGNCRATVFINGSLKSFDIDFGTWNLSSATNTSISLFGNGTNYLNGNIDDFRIYDKALTHEEVTILYQSGLDGKIIYPAKIVIPVVNTNTITKENGYNRNALLWTYNANSASSPYLICDNSTNIQGLLNSFHMCNGFSIHFVFKKSIEIGQTRVCEIFTIANGSSSYNTQLIRAVIIGNFLRFYVGSIEYASAEIDSDVWYIVDLVCKISFDYSTMSLLIYLNGSCDKSLNDINIPYLPYSITNVSKTNLVLLIGYNQNLGTNDYERNGTKLYLENLKIFSKALSLEEIDGLIYNYDSWKGSSGFAPNGSNIYFPYGNVGIGTHNPRADFHVVGNTLVELGDIYKKTQVYIENSITPDISYNFTTLPTTFTTSYLLSDNNFGLNLTFFGIPNNTSYTGIISSGTGFSTSAQITYNSSFINAFTWNSSASSVYLYHNDPSNITRFLDKIDNNGFTMHFLFNAGTMINRKIPIFFTGFNNGVNLIYISVGSDNKVYFKSMSKSKDTNGVYIEDTLASTNTIIANRWYIIDILFEIYGGTVSLIMHITDTTSGITNTVNKIIDFFEKFDINKILKIGYVYRWETESGAYDDRFENVLPNNLVYRIGSHPLTDEGNIAGCSIQDFRIYNAALTTREINKLKTGSININQVQTALNEKYGIERWKSSDGYYTNDPTKFLTYNGSYIGIGTTNPLGKFHIVHEEVNGIKNYPALIINNNHTSNTVEFFAGSTPGLIMDRYGHVGMGTTIISSRMHIVHNSTNSLTTETQSSSIYGIGLLVENNNTTASTANNSVIVNRITSASTGKVIYGLDTGDFAWSIWSSGNNDTNKLLRINSTINGDISNSANDKFVINGTNGNVGIGSTIPASKLDVNGTAAISANTSIGGDLEVKGGDITTNQTTFNLLNTTATTVNFAGAGTAINIGATSGTTAIKNNMSITGTLGVTGATTLSSTLGVAGNVAINGTKFSVTATSGNTSVAGTLGVTGATTLSSTLGVSGATTLSSTLGVSGATTLSSSLGVTGATTLSSTLGVAGDVAINTNKFYVTAASGNTSVAGTLGVTGATTIGSTLSVTGEVQASGDIVAYYSDSRLKTITSNIDNALNIVNNLNGFYYTANDLAHKYGYSSNTIQIGLSAQDVQKVLPEIVKLAPFDSSNIYNSTSNYRVSISGENYLTISYDRLAPVFVEAIKQLNTKIEDQNNTISELKQDIYRLESLINNLSQKII